MEVSTLCAGPISIHPQSSLKFSTPAKAQVAIGASARKRYSLQAELSSFFQYPADKWIDENGVVDLTDFFALSKHNKVLREKWSGSTLVRKLECVRGKMSVDIELCPRPDYARDKGSMKGTEVKREDGTYHQTICWVADEGDSTEPDDVPEFFATFCTHDRPVNTPKMFQPISLSKEDKPRSCRARFDLQEGQQIFMIMCNRKVGPNLTKDLIINLETETYKFWTSWIRACPYRGRFQQEVERSMLILKLLTYDPTGAVSSPAC